MEVDKEVVYIFCSNQIHLKQRYIVEISLLKVQSASHERSEKIGLFI